MIRNGNLPNGRQPGSRVQKKSRLRGSEPEEDALYVVFQEGFVICINNPVSAKFSVHVTSTVKRIPLLQLKFPRHTQCTVQELRLVLIVVKEDGL